MNQHCSWQVQESEEGWRLDVFLAHHLAVSRKIAAQAVDTCRVNGEKRKASHALKTNDEVVCDESTFAAPQPNIEAPESTFTAFPPVLFEDEHLIIINKPRGLIVHAGAGEKQVTLVDLLRQRGTPLSSAQEKDRAGIVHRLDKETSGAMVVCKTDATHAVLQQMFAERRVKKTYQALVCGVPPERGIIDAPIFRHPVKRKKMSVQPTGRPAITEYKVLSSWQHFALVEVDLKTGRTHQIRVHFQYIHHPVVGDPTYGGYKRAINSAQNESLKNALQNLHHQALHAAKLQFEHPITKVLLIAEAPLPEDMAMLVELLDGNS